MSTDDVAPRPVEERLRRNWREARADRDKWVRAFNRLEKAVTNHITDRCIDSDDLAHVHKAILREIGPKETTT